MSVADEQAAIQWAEATRWFAKADEDVRVAELSMAAEPPLNDPAAFHCQQAAEKIIKGLLVAAAVAVPRTHDLEVLALLAAPIYPALKACMDAIAPASAWLARTRYPDLLGGLGECSSTDVQDILGVVRAFRQAVEALRP